MTHVAAARTGAPIAAIPRTADPAIAEVSLKGLPSASSDELVAAFDNEIAELRMHRAAGASHAEGCGESSS